jgi:hypothetical protein
MQQIEILSEIEETFAGIIEALSPSEFQSNRKLIHKTKKVAVLLAKIPSARKEDLGASPHKN